jgi:hypothetical protein
MTDYRVDPLSIQRIECHAQEALANCRKLPGGGIDILAALRQPTVKTVHGRKVLRLEVVRDELLPDDLAHVWSADQRVKVSVRISLWNKAADNDPYALKDLRHEYGHVVLHSGARTKSSVTLDRKVGGNAKYEFFDDECSAEKQADWFAAFLAMPSSKIQPSMDLRDICADWNVPLDEARWRLERLRATAPKRIPDSLRRDIDWLRAGSRVTPVAQNLWDQLPSAPDTSPLVARMVNGYLIEYCQYNQYTQTGWTVEAGRVVPLMLRMQG